MKKLIITVAIITLLGLALSFVTPAAFADEGYPAPIDNGYPVWDGYPVPIDYGYPIDSGYPEPIGYAYPEPELEADFTPATMTSLVIDEPTFIEEVQIIIEELEEIKDNQSEPRVNLRETIVQLVYIVKHYGRMLAWPK